MLKFKFLILTVLFASPVAPVFSAEPLCNGPCTIADLARLQSEVLMLKVDEEKKSTQKRITDLGNGKGSSVTMPNEQVASPMYSQPTFGMGGQSAATKLDQKPKLVSIVGKSQNLFAVMRLPDGTDLEAKRGMTIGDGYTVKEISVDGVFLEKDGKLIPAASAE